MTMPEPVDVPKGNGDDVFRVEASTFKGHDLASIRVWYPNAEGRMCPSKTGVTFKRTLLPRIIEALTAIDRADSGAGESPRPTDPGEPAGEPAPTRQGALEGLADVDESEIPF